MIADNRPEVLSPAGSPEQLIAAVRSGADAVYLGAGSMNARQSAKNFTDSELIEAAAYCREYGVRLYVVMNTLLFDDEMEQAGELFRKVCAMPADGVIVQDIGLASLMRAAAPDMPLHASTQMTVHNPAAAVLLKKMGFTRAVLARELSESEIREIAEVSPIELEVFVHGALCMSVSGQCYFSSMLGGRSGNRGRCAQPCRLPFRSGQHEYCLSLKDMSHIEYIDRLADIGVKSLKIEGRMKRPEYCAAATAACSAAAEGRDVPAALEEKLSAVFSRSGFTDGYFTARRGRDMFGHRTRDDVAAADSGTLASLHELYKKERSTVPLDMKITLRSGVPAVLEVSDSGAGHSVRVEGMVPSESDGGSIDADRLISQLSKTGGTAFIPGEIRCEVQEGLFMPASAVNAMRREALALMAEKRRTAVPVQCRWKTPEIKKYIPKETSLHVVFYDIRQIPRSLPEQIKRIYIPLECGKEGIEAVREKIRPDTELCVEAPRGMFGSETRLREYLEEARACGIKICMIHNIGLIEPVISAGMTPWGGFGLNVTNTSTTDELKRLGVSGCELSFELTLDKIASLGGSIPRGAIVYGYLPMMLTRNCPAALAGCKGKSDGTCSITDRMDKRFAVRCRMGCSELFNSVPLDMVGRVREIRGVDHHIVRFTTEDAAEISRVLDACRNGSSVGDEVTRGLYYRGVE